MNKYNFFWSGPFSQWYRSSFIIDNITYNCAEQYMMHQKALLFNDHEIAKKIMKTQDPRKQKALGKEVKNFTMKVWNEHCLAIVFRGNHAKFSQNRRLYTMLMNTIPSILVEASPYDTIWGIGLDEEKAKVTPEDQWPGTNWLGYTLTNLRDFFENEEIIQQELKQRKLNV